MVKKFNIFIVNPVNGNFETIEDWKKSPNPEKAEFVAIKDINGFGLIISKNLIKNELSVLKVDFNRAVKIACKFKPTNVYPGIHAEDKFRLPTRRECLDIYDARFQGLDDALILIGGDPLTDYSIWTGDEDPDPEYNSTYAFVFNGNDNYMENESKDSTYPVRPVSTLLPF